jgi:signal transduction histidine kinase
MRRSFGSRTLLAICSALVLLLGTLTAIQHQWSARVAAADVQREKEHLNSAASLFAHEFDELADRAMRFLQQDAWAAFQQGEKLASPPKMIGELYYLEFPEQGPERVERLSAEGRFVPAPRPDWLPIFRCAGVVIEHPPAMVAHLYDTAAADRSGDDGARALQYFHSWLDRCFVARIDQAYLNADLFPQLLRQGFGESAAREYDFAVVAPDRPQHPFYGAPIRPDLRKRFFSVQSLPRVSGIDVSTQSLLPGQRALVAPGRGRGRGGGGKSGARRGPQEELMNDQPMGNAGWSPPGIWELDIAHKGAPLAAVFEQRSRRVLFFSLGLEALLVTSVAFLIIGSRRMQRLADQKMRFVAGISHELRTPVAAIAMLSRNQADGLAPGPDRVKQYGELIHQQTRRLNDMIEQTLQYAGVNSGLPRPLHDQIDVRSLVREAVEQRRAEFERSGIEVEMAVSEDLPPVSGDAKLLRTAVDNLLGNAEKHAAAGHWIRVTALYSPVENEVQVAVEDRGAGIDPADQHEIFEPFSRGRAAIEAQVPGAGLGLSLVRSAVQAHGGAVTLVSQPGRGSIFTLHLPV